MPNLIAKAENYPDWEKDLVAIKKLEDGTPAEKNEAIRQITSALKALRDVADYNNARSFVVGNNWLERLSDWEKVEYLSERAIYYKDVRFIDKRFLSNAIDDLNIIINMCQNKCFSDKSYWFTKESWASWWLIACYRLKGDFKNAHNSIDIYLNRVYLNKIHDDDPNKYYEICYYNIVIERGLLHLVEKEFEQAIEDFEIAYEHIKDSYALCWLIACHRLIGDPENLRIAESLLVHAPQSFKKENHIKVEHAFLCLEANKYNEAIEIFSEILNSNPKYSLNEYAYQGCISALRLKKDFSGAKKTAMNALKHLPESERILAELGLVYLDLNQIENANFYFSKAYKIAPKWPQLALCQVDTMIRMNDLIEAKDLMNKLRSEHKESLIVREHLGWMYIRINDMNAAKEEFHEVQRITKDDNYSGAQDGLGAVLLSEGFFKEAAKKFKIALDNDNNKYKSDKSNNKKYYYVHLAWSLLRQGEPTEIVNDYCRKALSLDPDFSDAYNCLGAIYLDDSTEGFKNGNLNKDAENFLLKSIEINPVNGNYFDLGIIYFNRGQIKKSEEIFKKALGVNKHNAQAHFGLGLLYMHTKKLSEAIQELQDAMALDPDDNNIIQTYALALMLNSEHNKATMILSRAVGSSLGSRRLRLTLALSNIYIDEKYKIDIHHEDVLKILNESQVQSDPTSLGKNESTSPEANFVKLDLREVFLEGIIRYKLKEYPLALEKFNLIPRSDENYYDALRFAERINSLIKGNQNIKYIQMTLSVLSIGIMTLIWYLKYAGFNISDKTLIAMTPILIGFLAIAALLPMLARFKIGEIEALLAEGDDSRTTNRNGWVTCIISCVFLASFWYYYYQGLSKAASGEFKITDDIIIVMTPLLLALIILPILFSRLNQIKLPGLEAELRPIESAISSLSLEEIRLSFLPISFGTGRIQLCSLPPSISMGASPP